MKIIPYMSIVTGSGPGFYNVLCILYMVKTFPYGGKNVKESCYNGIGHEENIPVCLLLIPQEDCMN